MRRRNPETLRNKLEKELMKLFDVTGEKAYEDAINLVEELYNAMTDDEALDLAEKLFDLLRYDDAELRKLSLYFAATVVENL